MAWRAEAERAEARGGRLVMWSGWIDPEDEDDHERAGVRTHGPEGHRRCTEVADRAAAVLEAQGVKLLLRPHARHVLSDVPSCLTFLRSALGERVRLVLDPIGMLTASMAARAEEHLERIMSALARHPGVAAILLASGELVGHGDEQRVERRALHRTEIAIIDSRRLIAMVAEHARPETDLIIIDDGVKEQQEMLRMYGPGR